MSVGAPQLRIHLVEDRMKLVYKAAIKRKNEGEVIIWNIWN
tara:strand:+ start:551 stop:673 length:123 start_codon:yes stop_codon:yes gene_type:complete